VQNEASSEAILHWLSSAEAPPVRYLVARDFGHPAGSREKLDDLHEAVLAWEPLQQIIALQRPDGSFPNKTKTETGGPTLAALMLMARCGLRVEDECVARALVHVEKCRLYDGVFSVRGKGSGVLPCYVGIFARLVADMAGTEHPLFRSGVDWILKYQRFDHRETRAGGAGEWPYKSVVSYGGCWNSVTCYHSVGPTLRALSVLPPAERTPEVEAQIDAALEYLRIHRVYRKSATDKPLFRYSTKLFLFGGYRSNLLDVLEGIAEARPELHAEAWVQGGLDAAESQANDGRLIASPSYATELVDPIPLEEADKPSRFLTYQWEKIKRKLA
jgi:hypothetical protein